MPITVFLFSASGEQFTAPTFTLREHEVKSLALEEWIYSAGPQFRQGSVQVAFAGKRLELGGLLTLMDDTHSLVFEQELGEASKDFASATLEGVWWLPSDRCVVDFAMVNTSDAPVAVTVKVNQRLPVQLTLKSHETHVLHAQEAFRQRRPKLPTMGGISVQHTGAPGVVLAIGFVEDPSSGYSNVIEFTDPQTVKASRLDGAGLRIGMVAGEELTQHAVLRNVSDTPSIVKAQIPYTLRSGNTGIVPLPTMQLNPREVKDVNLRDVIKEIPGRSDLAAAGLEFSYNTAPGTVIASAVSLSPSGTQVFRLPLKDPNVQSSSTGNYPWSIDQNSSTVVYIKNTTDTPQQFTMHVGSNAGSYEMGVKEIEANQTLAFDLRQMRDDRVPDSRNFVIPADANAGQVHWSIRGHGSKALIGRAEQTDLSAGLSTTSSCGVCCPDSYSSSIVTPGSLIGVAGDTALLEDYEYDRDCYGSTKNPYFLDPALINWSCDFRRNNRSNRRDNRPGFRKYLFLCFSLYTTI